MSRVVCSIGIENYFHTVVQTRSNLKGWILQDSICLPGFMNIITKECEKH
jgi:hypothetical protein